MIILPLTEYSFDKVIDFYFVKLVNLFVKKREKKSILIFIKILYKIIRLS